MKTTVNFCDFQDAFTAHDRQDTFSYEGKRALFEYLEQYEEDTGEEIELDVIVLCCEYTEYKDIAEYNENYSEAAETLDDIQELTTVIPVDDDRFIIQNF